MRRPFLLNPDNTLTEVGTRAPSSMPGFLNAVGTTKANNETLLHGKHFICG
jgi:hypothetical protein